MVFKTVRGFLFQNKNLRQTVAKNFFWLVVGQIGSRVLRALIIIYAARILGAAEYGVFAYVLGLAGFFTVFADIGVNAILTREVARNPKEGSYYFTNAFWIKFFLLLITALLIIFAAPYFSKIEGAKELLIFVAILTFFDGLRELSIAFFRAKEKMEFEALLTTATNVAITIFGFIILYLATTAKALATTYALAASAGTIIGIIVLKEHFSKIFIFFRKDLIKIILNLAWPIALMGIMGALMLNIDILMLGYFKTASEVGFYAAGQKIIQLLYTLPALLAITLFPILSRLIGQNDNAKAKLIMEYGITTALLVAIPIAVGGIILSQSIIDFLYGKEYLPAVPAFIILILTIITAFPSSIIGNYILAYNQQKRAAWPTGIGAMSNVVLNLILIPPYGILGAAIATLISQTFYNGLMWRLAKKTNNFFVLRYLKKIALAVIIMGTAVFVFRLVGFHVVINILLSISVYFLALHWLKERTLREIKSLVKQ